MVTKAVCAFAQGTSKEGYCLVVVVEPRAKQLAQLPAFRAQGGEIEKIKNWAQKCRSCGKVGMTFYGCGFQRVPRGSWATRVLCVVRPEEQLQSGGSVEDETRHVAQEQEYMQRRSGLEPTSESGNARKRRVQRNHCESTATISRTSRIHKRRTQFLNS